MAPGPLIAVVDDDMSLREALAGLLSAYGYRIDAYASGYDLLASPKLAQYALFILDVQMPTIDGLQLQEGIIQAGATAPIIFLTSALDPEVRRRALAMGARQAVPGRRVARPTRRRPWLSGRLIPVRLTGSAPSGG